MTVTIREASPEDEKRWRELWTAYLAFYEVTVDADITDATWRRAFDPARQSPCALLKSMAG